MVRLTLFYVIAGYLTSGVLSESDKHSPKLRTKLVLYIYITYTLKYRQRNIELSSILSQLKTKRFYFILFKHGFIIRLLTVNCIVTWQEAASRCLVQCFMVNSSILCWNWLDKMLRILFSVWVTELLPRNISTELQPLK